jgi:hypothetical protein
MPLLILPSVACGRCGVDAADDLACGDPCCSGCTHQPGPGNSDYQQKGGR